MDSVAAGALLPASDFTMRFVHGDLFVDDFHLAWQSVARPCLDGIGETNARGSRVVGFCCDQIFQLLSALHCITNSFPQFHKELLLPDENFGATWDTVTWQYRRGFQFLHLLNNVWPVC